MTDLSKTKRKPSVGRIHRKAIGLYVSDKHFILDKLDTLLTEFWNSSCLRLLVPQFIRQALSIVDLPLEFRRKCDQREISTAQIHPLASFRIVFDTLSFRFLRYSEIGGYQGESSGNVLEDSHVNAINGVDVQQVTMEQEIASFVSDQTNLALISALFLTVWLSMLQQVQSISDSVPGPHIVFYVIMWGGGSVLLAFSCVVSVLYILGIQETANSDESLHFLKLLDYRMAGLGSQVPFYFFLTGCTLGVIGIYEYCFLFYPDNFVTLSVLLSGGLCLVSFAIINLIAALLAARRNERLVEENKVFVNLTKSDVEILMFKYLQDRRRAVGASAAYKTPLKIISADSSMDEIFSLGEGNVSCIQDSDLLISEDHFIDFITKRKVPNSEPAIFYHVHLFPKALNRVQAFYKAFDEASLDDGLNLVDFLAVRRDGNINEMKNELCPVTGFKGDNIDIAAVNTVTTHISKNEKSAW
jgi:hypothetical protein